MSFCHLLEIQLLALQLCEQHVQSLFCFWFLVDFFLSFVGLVFVISEASVVAVTHKLIRVLRWHAVIFHLYLWKELFHFCTALDYVDWMVCYLCSREFIMVDPKWNVKYPNLHI